MRTNQKTAFNPLKSPEKPFLLDHLFDCIIIIFSQLPKIFFKYCFYQLHQILHQKLLTNFVNLLPKIGH